MIKYRKFKREDLFYIFEITHNNARQPTIKNYRIDDAVWAANVLNWIKQSEDNNAVFHVAIKNDKIVGFLIALPTSWQYSEDVYLEFKELIVDESLSRTDKARIVMEFADIAEEEARKADLRGLSAFSIRDNSQSYSNFFCKRLGWTPCSGAKKIF